MTKWREAGLAYLLIAPTLLILLTFILWPAVRSLQLSFFDFDPFMTHRNFVGLENYQMLASSPDYRQSLQVTALFLLFTVLPTVGIGIVLALALDANPFFRGFFRSVILLPVAISSAMAAMLWVFIYNPSSGFLNYLLEFLPGALGRSQPNWLGDPDWGLFAVSITTVWKELGFTVIFFLAGLSSIPEELKNAARLDGAGRWNVFRHVTLPQLKPTLLFVSVVTVINSFQSFGQIHILTAGGPANATTTLVYNLYRDAFQNFQTGSASAQAVILFVLMLAATVVQFRFAQTKVRHQ